VFKFLQFSVVLKVVSECLDLEVQNILSLEEVVDQSLTKP
tara:strand:+ start:275 stop:394 length:120 start_codon:yes stop_codon:yes gene_type:complete